MAPATGVLYVVATPIGNLEDLTFRALRILKEVDLIAAEDTRRTAKLLAHYDIRKPLVSVREHNETRESPRLIRKLQEGQRIALVSDAGTPAIADPGARLVSAARENSIAVVPIPGPSAVTAALSVAGLTSPEFVFMAFPPATGRSRRDWFQRLASECRAVVFFEAPHRIHRTLSEAQDQLGDRPIHVFREMSKIHENYVKSPIIRLDATEARGEFTVVVEPAAKSDSHSRKTLEIASDLVGRLTDSHLFTTDELISIVALLEGITRLEAKRRIKAHRFSTVRPSQSAT